MREHKNKSGIYQIRNTVNNKVYIGKTKCFYKRYCQYVSDVRNDTSDRLNTYIRNAFKKYGFDAFEFSVLEFCSVEECSDRELHWMLVANCTNKEYGYNLRMDSSTGMIVHEETSEKIRNNLKKQWSDGVRDSHSLKLKESWQFRNREEQSILFSQTLTKYEYVVTYSDGLQNTMCYAGLVENGYKSVVSKFHRKQTDTVTFKDVSIERKLK